MLSMMDENARSILSLSNVMIIPEFAWLSNFVAGPVAHRWVRKSCEPFSKSDVLAPIGPPGILGARILPAVPSIEGMGPRGK